jgi:hypothetical protein
MFLSASGDSFLADSTVSYDSVRSIQVYWDRCSPGGIFCVLAPTVCYAIGEETCHLLVPGEVSRHPPGTKLLERYNGPAKQSDRMIAPGEGATEPAGTAVNKTGPAKLVESFSPDLLVCGEPPVLI